MRRWGRMRPVRHFFFGCLHLQPGRHVSAAQPAWFSGSCHADVPRQPADQKRTFVKVSGGLKSCLIQGAIQTMKPGLVMSRNEAKNVETPGRAPRLKPCRSAKTRLKVGGLASGRAQPFPGLSTFWSPFAATLPCGLRFRAATSPRPIALCIRA
jgi:hypothetical protein